jgi:pimeloyl-ACP methyl ester carboxylesterase
MRNGTETVRLRRLPKSVTVLALLALLAGCSGAPGQSEAAGTGTATRFPVPASDMGDPCLSPQQRAALLHFRSGNGALLAGLPLGEGERGVVFAHGNDGTMCDWLDYGQSPAQRGFAVLLFDLDGRGLSQPADDFFSTPGLDADVVSAVQTLHRRGARSVKVIGASVGGTVAVVAATKLGSAVSGVVEMSGPADPDAVRAAGRLRVPMLCVAAAGESGAPRDAHELCDAAREAPSAETLVLPDTSAHGHLLLNPYVDRHATELRARLDTFLDQ